MVKRSDSKKPNFLIIVADDLGFSDLGCYGGEIHTPHLDKLASTGIRMTDFHTASMCSPTRSMLMSGTDNHIAGLGQMGFWGAKDAPWKTRPGYENYLNDKVAAMSELFQDAGYYTTMSGKWHLGMTLDRAPQARGFDRSFALLPGGAPHFAYEPVGPDGKRIFAHWASLYAEDDKFVDSKDFPEDYYSSDYFTTKLIDFLKEHCESSEHSTKPFFAFLPFTAPHWPLQAPAEIIQKYAGLYNDGPDVLRQKRLTRQVELGLLDSEVEPSPVFADTKEWDDMTPEEKKWSSKTMEVFAAMVERLDWNVGRVFDYLESIGELEDTFILFMSDNGAEGAVIEALPMTGDVIKKSIDSHYNNDLENLGNRDSFIWYGPRWAQAATAPSRMHKGFITEGGIRCPCIINYAPFNEAFASVDTSQSSKFANRTTSAFTTVKDILPTLLELAAISPPPTGVEYGYRGRQTPLVPITGTSWVKHLSAPSQNEIVHSDNAVMGWELFFHQAVRKGNWKATYVPKPRGPEKWQLFNLETDKGEIHDLALDRPEILEELIRHWVQYVAEFGVFLREELAPDYPVPIYK